MELIKKSLRRCVICNTITESQKCILFKPSDIFVFFCDYHLMRVLSQKPKEQSIKDWIKFEKLINK